MKRRMIVWLYALFVLFSASSCRSILVPKKTDYGFTGTITFSTGSSWHPTIIKYRLTISGNKMVSLEYAHEFGICKAYALTRTISEYDELLAEKTLSSGILELPDQSELPSDGKSVIDGGWVTISIETTASKKTISYNAPGSHAKGDNPRKEDKIVASIMRLVSSQVPKGYKHKLRAEEEQIMTSPKATKLEQALIIAAFNLNVARVKELIASGCNVNARMGEHDHKLFLDKWTGGYGVLSYRWTALLAASESNKYPDRKNYIHSAEAEKEIKKIPEKVLKKREAARVEIAQLLLNSGAEINISNGSYTPLLAATRNEYEDLVVFLANQGAGVHRVQDKLLYYGIKNTHITKTLLAAGMDVSLLPESYSSGSPLKLAVARGNIEALKMFINVGAKIPNNQEDHMKLLRTAMESHHLNNQTVKIAAIIKILIDAGINVNICDKDGYTALHMAKYEDIVRVLIEAGADVNAKAKDGNTPLLTTITGGMPDFDAIKLLLDAGAKVNVKNKYGQTPLSYFEDVLSGLIEGATNWRKENPEEHQAFKSVYAQLVEAGRRKKAVD
ncbi:ankyrin repeat domain-containing protein [Verrucomicrobiota bacterium]